MRTDAILAMLGIVLLGWVYWLIAWWCVRRHFRGACSHRAELRVASPAEPAFMPSVSILKPLKGIDPELKKNLASFCQQNYGEYEILFGVRDEADPAVDVVQQLREEFPDRAIRLLVAPDLGLNPKSAILHHLSRRARYEVLVISDSDIRVTEDYLKTVVAPLQDPAVGLVTCPYRSTLLGECVAALEAMHIDLAFLPAAVIGSLLPGVRYAFGATMAMRAADLHRSGGYEAIADALGDDYAIGSRLADLGLKIRLSDYIVDHVASDGKFRELWCREVRWARTVQTIAPLHYMGLLVPLCTLWACGVLIVSGLAPWAWGVLGATLLLRWIVTWGIAGSLGNKCLRRWLAWLPIRDLLDAGVWLAGLLGHRVTWRGRVYGLRHDGTLVPPNDASIGLSRRLVRLLDWRLRISQGIFEYTSDPQCMFRINLSCAEESTKLRDGANISAGEELIELHIWNDHMPPIGPNGPDLAWANLVGGRIERSLHDLAAYISAHPNLSEIPALRANTTFMVRNERQLRRLVMHYGFEVQGIVQPNGAFARIRRFGENILVWLLVWTFNPGERKKTKLSRPRYAIWMSRSTLMSRYGGAPRRRNGDGRQPWKSHQDEIFRPNSLTNLNPEER